MFVKYTNPKKVQLDNGKGKPRDGERLVCSACGTNRVDWPDGTATMFGADGISTEKPNG